MASRFIRLPAFPLTNEPAGNLRLICNLHVLTRINKMGRAGTIVH